MQQFLDTYKMANLKIVEYCEIFCNIPIVNMTTFVVSSLDKLRDIVDKARDTTTIEHVELYQKTVDIIYVIYDGFESHIENVYI